MKIKLFLLLSSLSLTSSFVAPLKKLFRRTKYCISKKSKNVLKNSILLGDNIYKATNYKKKNITCGNKKTSKYT